MQVVPDADQKPINSNLFRLLDRGPDQGPLLDREQHREIYQEN